MKPGLDVVTIACAIFVAAYAAIATGYVAQYGFGFSLEVIRGTSLLIAVVMATVIAIDFFGKKLRKVK
jgi:ABC-type amino acid transport system permease subunit